MVNKLRRLGTLAHPAELTLVRAFNSQRLCPAAATPPASELLLNIRCGIFDQVAGFLDVPTGPFGGFAGAQAKQDKADDNHTGHGSLRVFLFRRPS